MPTNYERHLTVFYLANAAGRLRHRDQEASALADWLADRDNRPAYDRGEGPLSRLVRRDSELDEPISARQWRSLRQALRDECRVARRAGPDRTARRLRRLGEATGLNALDIDILEVLLRYQTQPVIESLVDHIFGRNTGLRLTPFNVRGAAIPSLLGASPGTIQRRFECGAPLVSSGLVVIDRDGDLRSVDRLQRLATIPGGAGFDVTRLLLEAAPRSDLEWADFDHIAEGRDHVERLIRGALQSGAPGVNVVLHGPPGTGKTEFCKVLAERLGVTLYSAGETDDDGDEPVRRERLQDLRLAQRLLGRNGGSLLLFDEMEDLLSDIGGGWAFPFAPPRFASTQGSKVYMHRLLERAPAPTLWTMNDVGSVSRTMLRRMMFALELRPPTAALRARIWARQLEHHGIEAGPGEADALAREFAATPGIAAGATAAARIGGGGIDAVRRGVRGLSRALSCETPPQGTPPRFDAALIHADIDPVALAERLIAGGNPCFSLCLQGPPGTGKSAFVRYLAERMGLEVMHKRASDLMSMWVGETEKAIAAAFAEARDTGAFLVLDEADSLLADRRFAQRSWEVSRVNEMLTWMESHPAPFACTTNFAEHLDAATLRRFVFKVALGYLSPVQVETAFRAYFGFAAPAQVTALTALTPGDFAVVRRKAALLRQLDEAEALAAMLSAECAAKPDRPRPLGFRPSP